MRAILEVILIVLDLYVWLLIASAILSWLIAFNVVNTRNQFVAILWTFTSRLVEPVLAYIRRWLPFLRNLGGFDLSPVILLIVLHGIDNYFLYPMSIPGYFA